VMSEMGKAMMGTGEGEGENRALEAAERAIANPLLDGVSMQGAKGVIISIIGGEDMKLLEVDEAANHIRELVDEDANIIWGSAFNPDLQGKIRVSVVATGIEQTAEMAKEASRPLNLGRSRGPVLPSAAKPQPIAFAPEPFVQPASPPFGTVPSAEPEPPVQQDPAPEPEAAASPQDDASPAFELPQELAVEQTQAEPEAAAQDDAPADESAGQESAYASLTGIGRPREEPLDLGLEQVDEPESAPPPASGQDELLLDADRLASEDAPVSERFGRLGGEQPPASAAPAAAPAAESASSPPPPSGTTLFERMANLSRSRSSSDSDEEEESASSISIPRFLGRQNNQ
jgi:cell division protein FtsZ